MEKQSVAKPKKPLFTTRDLAYTIVMTALLAVVTMTLKIPMPMVGGYLDPGEFISIFTGITFGVPVGAVVGGLGPGLADLLGGYPFWMPITLAVRGLEGAIFGLGFRRSVYWKIAAAILGQVWMNIGYFMAYWPLYGWAAAVASTLPFAWMMLVATAIAIPLHYAVLKAYPRLAFR
jgi:uncharacterized membrane protein